MWITKYLMASIGSIVLGILLVICSGCQLMDAMNQAVHEGVHLEDASTSEIMEELGDRALDSITDGY